MQDPFSSQTARAPTEKNCPALSGSVVVESNNDMLEDKFGIGWMINVVPPMP